MFPLDAQKSSQLNVLAQAFALFILYTLFTTVGGSQLSTSVYAATIAVFLVLAVNLVNIYLNSAKQS